jgi:hypothetical protein
MPDLFFRCSDGHLFTATWLKIVFLTVHFGNAKWMRCPVDHKWRMAYRIGADTLSETELDEAKRHRF